MPGLLDAFKQYVRDALPGGALNREVTPQGLLDAASIATIPVPVVGDVTGLAADLYRMRDPQERTPLNIGLAALGALPLVPPVLSVARKGDKVADVLRAADRVPAPQEAALETARRNAVKMLGLPENNTAMDRARALGFVDAYHGTNDVIENFSISHAGKKTGNPTTGLGISVATSPNEASRYTHDFGTHGSPNVMPLMVRTGDVYDMPYGELNGFAMRLFNGPGETVADKYKLAQQEARDFAAKIEKQGFGAIRAFSGKPHEEIFVRDPSRIRSRFAAFDPARINENDLLGRADPALLAILAGGGLLGGGAYYLSDK